MLRIYKSVSRIYKLRAKILSLLFREEERKKKGRNIGTITMSSEHWSIEREAKNKGENARKQKDEGRATCRVSAITIVKNVADIFPLPPQASTFPIVIRDESRTYFRKIFHLPLWTTCARRYTKLRHSQFIAWIFRIFQDSFFFFPFFFFLRIIPHT